jgi:hypothetical protein
VVLFIPARQKGLIGDHNLKMHNNSGDMQADIFEVILSFLGPKDACSLASVSRTFCDWVDSSVMWKEWCEKACPSIEDPPAKAFVEALYGAKAKAGRSYKQLFLELKRSLHQEALSQYSTTFWN